ncbi:hypothetical protein LSUB1_G003985 [Lachnellula subtilissima]|uniref:NACHT domain-containing protein n=1 Tax=Lachnellula subtilissima TaxID=602034 RepID=A0A8H8RPK6_9HELO|nr:hypothetical protein LSUB1_G003985 [Lachnellula subtilissima]
MLDPLAALGVAGNIVQFVDFTVKLISKSHELHKSADGASTGNKDLEAIAGNLKRLTERLRTDMSQHLLPPVRVAQLRQDASDKRAKHELASKLRDYTPENRAEIELGEINAKCTIVAGDLLSILRMFKVEGKNNKWKSFRMALKSVWDEDQIQAAMSKLTECRKELDTELLISLRTSINDAALKQSNGFESLGTNTQDISETLDIIRNDNKQNQQEIIKAIKDHQWQGDNPVHVAKFSARITEMVEQKRISFLREKFLHQLGFMNMSDRQEEILPAHSATFNWIYKTRTDQRWASFSTWLRQGKGTYWIAGKAGSGKSTLMKYIYNNPLSRTALERWAGDFPLITASYYFWNAGTPMQKSQTRLLQSLLYESLTQCEDLIPLIFPYRWRSYDFYGDDISPWGRMELMKGFDRSLKQDGVSAKFCFFVDGLDEYDGDHREVVKLFQGVAASSSVKMCLSSRPLLIFEDAFGRCPKLVLQDLTQNDIKLYTDIELVKSPQFEILRKRETARAQELVTEIVDKSAGVFLWVTLVVKSLLEGLQNSDRISDLQRRLEALPADLEDLYLLMMMNLDKFYQQQASQLFQIVHRARLPLSVLGLSFADEEDPDFAIRARLEALDDNELSFRYSDTVRRVNSRCKGLLEVRASSGKDRLVDSKIDFLHRTVKDFLDTPNIWNKIASQSDPSFNPDISLMRSYLVQMKVLCTTQWEVGTFGRLAGEFMEYAAQAEKTSGQVQSSLIENFCETATELWYSLTVERTIFQNEGRYAWVKVIPQVYDFLHDPQLSFLSLAVSYGLDLYVKWKLNQNSQPVTTRLGRPLLHYATAPMPRNIWGTRPRNPELVAVLLKHGADPNREFGNHTTWTDVLIYAYEILRPLKSGDKQELLLPVLECMRLLLAAGANPEACIYWKGSNIPAVTVIDDTFSRKFPEEVHQVRQVIYRKLEEKVGPRRAIDIEKQWEQTPQELRRQVIEANERQKEQRLRDEQVKEQRAKDLAVLYGKKTMTEVQQDDIFTTFDQEPWIMKFPWEESRPTTPVENYTVHIKDKKRRAFNLQRFAFWNSRRSK